MGYLDIDIPEGKDRKEYNFTERRAELLKLLLAAGHPGNINQAALARTYGITPQMLSKDVKAIKEEFIGKSTNDAEFITQAIFHKALKIMAKSEAPQQLFMAAKLAKEWNDWLFDMGRQKRSPQEMSIRGEYTLADAVKEVLDDNDEPGESTKDSEEHG